MKKVRWKFLLGVFKIKRYFQNWYGTRKMDFHKDILVATDTLKEYEVRSQFVRKEPDTAAWIEKTITKQGEGGVLYDIGANIGACSLIAATLGAKVFAFEPASQNIYKINKNALLNKLNTRITVVPIALAEKEGVIESYGDTIFGVTHTFSFQERDGEQSFPAMSLDNCIKTFTLPAPTMLKIDVDGAEMSVMKGARKTLSNNTLKDIIIEIDDKNTEAVSYLENLGFKLVSQRRISTWCGNFIFER